jgi:hypothetical protein
MIDELEQLLHHRYLDQRLYGQRGSGLELLVLRRRRVFDSKSKAWEEVWELRLPLEKPRRQSAASWRYDNMGGGKKELGATFQARSFQSVVALALVFIKTA